MRFAVCAIAVLSLSMFGVAQPSFPNEWTWQGGNAIDASICQWPTFCGQAGVYGTQGVFAPGNYPGNLSGAASAADNQGRLWLYGGYGMDANGFLAYLADLWMFDPATKQWEWVSGSNTASVNYTPGQWGQLGIPASSNSPGTRNMASAWLDSQGNFWLFGGYAVDSGGNGGRLNDLWKYDVSTKQWTWVAGSNLMTMCGSPYPNETVCLQPGNPGQLGIPGPGNTPGGRVGEVTWTDNSGNLWLFGGLGVDANGTPGNLNDLWKFDPSTNEWAWMSGSGVIVCDNPGPFSCLGSEDPSANYGTLGVAAPSNVPGGKNGAVGWKDNGGNLWLFGGTGKITTSRTTFFTAIFGDLWEYNPSSTEWTWMGGNATTTNTPGSFPGVYGTLGVNAATNIPGSRSEAVGWTDRAGNLWLFGGAGNDSTNTYGYLNDLWVFTASTKNWAWMGGTPMIDQVPIYGTMGIPGIGNRPGSLVGASGWADLNGNLWLFAGTPPAFPIPYDNVWEYQPANTLPPAVTPIFVPLAGTYTAAQNVTITNGMTNAAIYYTNDGSTPTTNSIAYTGPVFVSTSQTLKAIAVASGYPNSGVASATYVIQPPAATPIFSQASGTYNGTQSVTITDPTPQATIYFTTDGTTPTTNSSVYSGAITVSTSETLEAIAAAPGYSASQVISAQYAIADFSLSTVNPAAVVVTHGQSGHAIVSLNSVNGFSSAVSFGCTGLPAGSTCSFNPPTVTPSGASVSTTINISTSGTGMSARVGYQQQFALAFGIFAICAVGLGAPWKYRRGLLLLLCVAAVMTLGACGGGSSTSTFIPITSTVTVTASSGSLQHTTTFTLTIR